VDQFERKIGDCAPLLCLNITSDPITVLYSISIGISGTSQFTGHTDTGAKWRMGYDAPNYDFRANIEALYNEIRPLYKEVCYN